MARWLLQHLLHADDREPALADLDEEFETRATRDGVHLAVRWYRAQVRQSLGPALLRRVATTDAGWRSVPTELRWAWRGVRARRFGGVAHVGLVALAVGASAVVFSAADSFAFRQAPYPNATRLLIFQRTSPVGIIDMLQPNEYLALRARSDLFSGLYAHGMGPTFYVRITGVIEPVRTYDVQPGLFEALGVLPRWGRPLLPGDARAGSEPVALVREDLARSLFGDPVAAIGQTIPGVDASRRIVGIMSAGFRFPTSVEKMWRPLADVPAGAGRTAPIIASVAPGVPMQVAEEFVEAYVRSTAPTLRGSIGPAKAVPLSTATKDPRAYTNAGAFNGLDAPRLFETLLGAATCLALVVCLNVAGLELATAIGRARVHAVQTALGATRGTLIRTALFEGIILTMTGAVAGVGLAAWGTRALAAALPQALDQILANPIDLDLRTAVFMAVVALAATLMTSLAVVWQASRPMLADRLRRDAPTLTGSRAQNAIRHAFMTGEIALCSVLLVIAVLAVRTYTAHLNEDKGFDGTNLAAITVSQPSKPSRPARDLDREIAARLQADPRVLAWARADRVLPGFRGGSASYLWRQGAASTIGQVVLAPFGVDAAYFGTMGIRLVSGQFPGVDESQDRIVVDEAFARRFWPSGDAVGARFSLGRAEVPGTQVYETAGVAAHIRLDAATAPNGGDVFVFHRLLKPDAAPLTYVLRLASAGQLGDVAALTRSVADDCIVRATMMDDRYAQIYGDTRIAAGLSGAFGIMAFVVAMVGLYGVTAFLVAGRTREIGIRLALGADRRDIRRLVLRPALGCVALGISAGIAGALFASRLVETRLIGSGSTDVAAYVGVAVAVAVTALLATWRPARRAVKVDPAITLRAE